MGGRGWTGWSGVRGGKWDHCNSTINKYIKKMKKKYSIEKEKKKKIIWLLEKPLELIREFRKFGNYDRNF